VTIIYSCGSAFIGLNQNLIFRSEFLNPNYCSCIARPMFGMSFGTVKLLDIVRQDQLSYKYKITDGFIVDEV